MLLAVVVSIVACLTVRVITSTHAIRVKVLGTLGCDLSETKEASTGAADMSASRVEVGDGVPCGSEHDQ